MGTAVGYLIIVVMFTITITAQTNTIATDTIKIAGQNGNVNLITGDSNRTLNFPNGSGTLALEGSGSGLGGQCCPSDTSAVYSYTWQTVANDKYVSDAIDVGRFSKELNVIMQVLYPTTINAYGSVKIETAADLNSGFWWPVIEHLHYVTAGFDRVNFVIRPTQEYVTNYWAPSDINRKVCMHGWLKYIRVVGQLGGGQPGRQMLVAITIR